MLGLKFSRVTSLTENLILLSPFYEFKQQLFYILLLAAFKRYIINDTDCKCTSNIALYVNAFENQKRYQFNPKCKTAADWRDNEEGAGLIWFDLMYHNVS